MEPSTPRRGHRMKKMSLKAVEAQQIKGVVEFDDFGQDDPIFSDDSSEEDEEISEESSSEGDEDIHEEGEEENISGEESEHPKPKYLIQSKTNEGSCRGKKKKTAQSYVIKSEDYFFNNAVKKLQTSNHTLDTLKKPKLSQEELQKLLLKLTITENHEKIIKEISLDYKNFFNKWLCLLHEGFNILTYGLGSKRDVLNQFQAECLTDLPVIVVNGFFPSLTVKDILDSILEHILEISDSPSNSFDAADLISEEFLRYPNLHLYLIVHNIEGEILRNSKNQSVLAKLADIQNVHLIVSIDHINAPLIWDQNKLSKFNFTWWDITSFLPYRQETSFETSMMINKSGSLALSSLKNVFLSLTSNSKGIYLVIVRYQLKNSSHYYQGMLFKELYSACREAFLVSSDLALRAQLTEFVDHKMVKFKRSADGAEHLIIPIQNNLLQQFLNDQ